MILAIMFKESFRALDLNTLGVTALLIFVACFVAIAVWVAARPREEVKHWSDLPLADDADPLKPQPAPIPHVPAEKERP